LNKVIIWLLPKVFFGWADHNPAVLLTAGSPSEYKKSLLIQGDENLYGDNSVSHYRLKVKPTYDEEDIRSYLPSNRYLNSHGEWRYGSNYNERFDYDSELNKAFGVLCYPYSEDVWEYGILEPKGTVRFVGHAIRIYEENSDIFYQVSSGFDPSVVGIPYPDTRLGWLVWPQQLMNPDAGWLWNDPPEKIFDHTTGVIHGDYITTTSSLSVPFIPYYWVDWMLENKPKPTTSDHGALSECFRNTVTEYTSTGMNNIANISETIGMIRDIRSGHIDKLFSGLAEWAKDAKSIRKAGLAFVDGKWVYKGSILRDTSRLTSSFLRKVVPDMWLKYRYLYNTTKMDAEAAVDYALKRKYIALDGNQVLRGRIGISTGTINLKMRLTQKHDLAMSIQNMLGSQGLFPDSHTLWDLVPFSFVADWFSPGGSDALEDWDQRYLSEFYSVDEMLVTTKEEWTIEDFGHSYTCYRYERSFLDEPPQFEVYQEPKHSRSKSVITKRIADGASLIINYFN
jgi:hypothetical protein